MEKQYSIAESKPQSRPVKIAVASSKLENRSTIYPRDYASLSTTWCVDLLGAKLPGASPFNCNCRLPPLSISIVCPQDERQLIDPMEDDDVPLKINDRIGVLSCVRRNSTLVIVVTLVTVVTDAMTMTTAATFAPTQNIHPNGSNTQVS